MSYAQACMDTKAFWLRWTERSKVNAACYSHFEVTRSRNCSFISASHLLAPAYFDASARKESCPSFFRWNGLIESA